MNLQLRKTAATLESKKEENIKKKFKYIKRNVKKYRKKKSNTN